MPPYPGCPGPFFTFYAFTLTFSTFTYAFFRKTPSFYAPRLDARGRRTPRTPLCTPLSGNVQVNYTATAVKVRPLLNVFKHGSSAVDERRDHLDKRIC